MANRCLTFALQEFFAALIDAMHEEAMRGGIPQEIYEKFLQNSTNDSRGTGSTELRSNSALRSLPAFRPPRKVGTNESNREQGHSQAKTKRLGVRPATMKRAKQQEQEPIPDHKGPLFYRYQPSDHVATTTCGTMLNRIQCAECQYESTREEPFSHLSVDISAPRIKALSEGDVEDCLLEMVQPEELSGDNAYYCSSCCKYVTAHKQRMPNRLPYVRISP